MHVKQIWNENRLYKCTVISSSLTSYALLHQHQGNIITKLGKHNTLYRNQDNDTCKLQKNLSHDNDTNVYKNGLVNNKEHGWITSGCVWSSKKLVKKMIKYWLFLCRLVRQHILMSDVVQTYTQLIHQTDDNDITYNYTNYLWREG